MSYTMLKNPLKDKNYDAFSLEGASLRFIRERCEGLRFDEQKAKQESQGNYLGTSLKAKQIPYNMEKDIDRLCLENALDRFLQSGKKEDAFDVYFCYLEMFIGDYDKTRRMIELLSEFEANGSSLLMKHRDHYSHSVYVFALGLAIYETNAIYREQYQKYCNLEDEHAAAAHFLQFWGLSALFHDIGYPFELPFEQVASYFEVGGKKREDYPFVAYHDMSKFIQIDSKVQEELQKLYGRKFVTTDSLFACLLADKLSQRYPAATEEKMLHVLEKKPSQPNKFGCFMDHAYFSATVLFKKLFEEMQCSMKKEHLDALTAILMHNSLYKFSIAFYKEEGTIPFKPDAELNPLAYLLMLCDELQCWDRTAYGRNSKKELHPMNCLFDFSNEQIHATYLYDQKEIAKINRFKDEYIAWLEKKEGKEPELKAYSKMFLKTKDGKISSFQDEIEHIVDLTQIRLQVDTGVVENKNTKNRRYLSDSNFLNLYNFAIVLNGRWNNAEWKLAKATGQEEKFIMDEKNVEEFTASFKTLSLEYKLSNINQAKAFAKYMNEIGCFYTDKPVDFDMLESFTKEDLLTIGLLEHQRWLQEHYDMGWIYGEPSREERELLRQHKDMIPDFKDEEGHVTAEAAKKNYYRLDKEEQDKDTDPMECMLAMLKMFGGLRIYRLK